MGQPLKYEVCHILLKMSEHQLNECPENTMVLSSQDRYTLSNRWIVRSDSGLSHPYLLFDIYSGNKFKITNTVFIILKILEFNSLTIEEIGDYLSKNTINVSKIELVKFVDDIARMGIIIKSGKALSSQTTKHSQTFEEFDVPITSTPYEVEIHFTKACNLRCLHCIYDAGRKLPNELEPILWCKVFNELESLKVLRIIISGGEPLVYPFSRSLIEHLSSKKIRVDLLTNGTLTDKDLAHLLSAPNFSITVSLDGASPETHNLLRGIKCFDKVLEGLKLLSEAKSHFHIAVTMNKKNLNEMEDIVETAIHLGAKSVNFIILDPLGRAKYAQDLLLDTRDIAIISDKVRQLAEVYGESYIGYLDPSLPNYKDLDVYKKTTKIFCTAGTSRLAIRSDGMVFPCTYAFHDNKFAMGSIRSKSIEEIWSSTNWNLFRGRVELQDLHECKSCMLSSVCTLKLCRLRAYYSTGDFFGAPPGCQKVNIMSENQDCGRGKA